MFLNKVIKTVISIILIFNAIASYAQDTIYSDAYPKGIVVPTIDINDYKSKQHPINNSELELIIPKKEVIKITNSNGDKYVNPDYNKSDNIVVPIENTTGKVNYVGIIEMGGTKQKVLFNALKTLPFSNIEYTLISSDEAENSFMQYRGKFNTKFAGDLYDVIFTLTIKFKDGKIKYNYHDFMFCFEEIKQKHLSTIVGATTTSAKYRKSDPLEKFYIPGYRGDKFWNTIYLRMDESVKALYKTSKDFAGKDDF